MKITDSVDNVTFPSKKLYFNNKQLLIPKECNLLTLTFEYEIVVAIAVYDEISKGMRKDTWQPIFHIAFENDTERNFYQQVMGDKIHFVHLSASMNNIDAISYINEYLEQQENKIRTPNLRVKTN